MKRVLVLGFIILIASAGYAQKQRNILFGTAIITATTGIIIGEIIDQNAIGTFNSENTSSLNMYESYLQNGTLNASDALSMYNNQLHNNKVKYDKAVKTGAYIKIAGASLGCIFSIVALSINNDGKLALWDNGKQNLLLTQRGTQIGLAFNF